MSTVNIYLARHGETEYNRTNRIQGRGIDASLNETGRQQAKAIGAALQDKGISRIFSSSLRRSKETAQIAAEQLELPVEDYSELDEMNFGIIEGKPIDEIGPQLDELHENWRSGRTSFAFEKGESPDTVLERVSLCMDTVLNDCDGTNVLFVLHGRLIRILLSHWLGYGLQDMHRIPHQNGALYHVQLREQEITPVFINDATHLEHLNRTSE